MSSVTCIQWSNLEGIQMENQALRIVILPQLGGKIASVCYKKKNFELAAQNSKGIYQIPMADAEFSQYDASGLDDAFPNIVETKYRYGNKERKYPDHGEIWSSPFSYEIQNHKVNLFYRSERFGYTYKKIISLEDEKVNLQYEIKNEKDIPFPCLWTFHGLIRYEEDMEFFYPKEVQSFENVLQSQELGAEGRHLPMENGEYDFCRVPLRKSETMVKYYADKKIERGYCGCRYPAQGMECILRYNAKDLPYLGVWITAGGFRGDYNCALEPSNGYYDDIFTAEKNQSLYLLKKEEPLTFHLEILIKELQRAETGGRQ